MVSASVVLLDSEDIAADALTTRIEQALVDTVHRRLDRSSRETIPVGRINYERKNSSEHERKASGERSVVSRESRAQRLAKKQSA